MPIGSFPRKHSIFFWTTRGAIFFWGSLEILPPTWVIPHLLVCSPNTQRLLFYTKKQRPNLRRFTPPVNMLGATPCCLGRCAGDLKEVMGSSPFPLKAQRPRVRIPKGRKMWRFSGWWQLTYFFIFIPKFGEDEPILTNIFQRG